MRRAWPGCSTTKASAISGSQDAPDFVPRQVTHYKGDDGQAIASVRLTPDGKTIVYARGSEIEQRRHVGKSDKPDKNAEAAGVGGKRERR